MSSNYLSNAIFATLLTWGLTALGSATVFIIKKINNKIMSLMFGFGAGVMLAATFFSLIAPGIELANELNQISYLTVGSGVLFGALFILIIDILIQNKLKIKQDLNNNFSRKLLLVLAITLHNIPEGLAIGVAFGSNIDESSFISAWILAIGIGLQNFPEGMAVSIPLRTEKMSRMKSFFYGQASGIVEPLSAIIGVLLVVLVRPILPFILGFASGAMIYVVVEELIPSSKTSKENKYGPIGVIIGFVIMMMLDIALG